MKRKGRELLTIMKPEIIDSFSYGCLTNLLAVLGSELTADDYQKIQRDLNNRGVNEATDNFVDCLRCLDEEVFRKFIKFLRDSHQTQDLFFEFVKQCRKGGLEYLLEEPAKAKIAQSDSSTSKRESARKVLMSVKPLVRERMTEGDMSCLRMKLAAEISADDMQQIQCIEEQKGSMRAFDALVDCLSAGSKKSYTIFIEFIRNHKQDVYEEVKERFQKQGLNALLPKENPLILSGNETTKSSNAYEMYAASNIDEYLTIAQPCTQSSKEEKIGVSEIKVKVDRYKMTSRPGICLIISNKDFSATRKESGANLEDRIGTEVDVFNLESIFEWLGFDVKICQDMTTMDLWKAVLKCKNEIKINHYCVVVCILTHGLRKNGQDQIYGIDGKAIPLDNVFEQLNGKHCKELVGKPKLFFLQCCRGENSDYGSFATGVNQCDGPLANATEAVVKMPIHSDFFIGYATPPGYRSWRNTVKGSWYVSKLCEVFRDMAREFDLLTMMTKVNAKVSECYTRDNEYNQLMQVPYPSMSLTKLLYFTPG